MSGFENKLLVFSSTSPRPVLRIDGVLRENSYSVERFQSTDDLLRSPSLHRPCIILLELGLPSDVDRATNFLDTAGSLLSYVKIIVYSLLKTDEIRDKFSVYAVADFIEGPLPERTVVFKIGLLQKILNKNEDSSTKVNASKQILFQEKAVEKMKNGALQLKAKGPSSASGDWLMDPNAPKSSVRWRWIPKIDSGGVSHGNKVDAVFVGAKAPVFNSQENLWIFESALPQLEHYVQGELISSTKDSITKIKLQEETSADNIKLFAAENTAGGQENTALTPEAKKTSFLEEKNKVSQEKIETGSWKIKKPEDSAVAENKKITEDPKEPNLNWKFSDESSKADKKLKVRSSSTMEYVKKIKEEELVEGADIKKIQKPEEKSSLLKDDSKEKTEDIGSDTWSMKNKRGKNQTQSSEEDSSSVDDSEVLNRNKGKDDSEQVVGAAHSDLRKKDSVTQADSLQDLFKKTKVDEETKQDLYSQSIRLPVERDNKADDAAREEFSKRLKERSVKKLQMEEDAPPGASGAKSLREDDSVPGKKNETDSTQNTSDVDPKSGENKEPVRLGAAEQQTSQNKNTEIDSPSLESVKAKKQTVGSEEEIDALAIFLSGTIIKNNQLIKLEADAALAKILSTMGLTQNRKYFLLGLEELGDDNSTWERAGDFRVYISAKHKYFGVPEVKSALPLWIYKAMNMPQFIEERKMWLFLDYPPYVVKESHDLPSPVFQYLISLMELFKRQENKGIKIPTSVPPKGGDELSSSASEPAPAEKNKTDPNFNKNLDSGLAKEKTKEFSSVTNKNQTIITKVILRILNFFKF